MAKVTDVQIALAALHAGWVSESDVTLATAIALAESGGRSDATNNNTNGSIDYGLWQVNSVHGYPPAQLLTVDGNAKAAHSVFLKQGWRAWSVFKSGAYFPFMLRAKGAARVAIANPGAAGGGPGGPVTDTDVIPDSLEAPFKPLGKLIDALIDPHNWVRLGMFTLGGILLIVALFKFTGDNQLSSTTKGVVRTAAKVAITRKP